jgi:hypothetical protein
MSRTERAKYIRELGNASDFASLAMIYRSGLPDSSVAAAECVTRMDSAAAIRFCSGLPINSANWRAAFWSLRWHPRDQVIQYITATAQSDIPEVRYMSYRVCMLARWKDLVSQASKDLNNKDAVYLPNLGEDEGTVADAARNYLRTVVSVDDRRGLPTSPEQTPSP